MYQQRVQDAKRIDALVLQLNRNTNLCFHVVQVLQDKPAYTDAFVYETKHHYTQALRLMKKADGSLLRAVDVNFNPAVRFEQPSIAEVIGDAAAAIVAPELVATRSSRPGELRLEPVQSEAAFDVEPAREVARRYVPAREVFNQNQTMFGKLFNKYF